jgi:hypothetical protein
LHAFNHQTPSNHNYDIRDEKCYDKTINAQRASSALKMTSNLNVKGHTLK